MQHPRALILLLLLLVSPSLSQTSTTPDSRGAIESALRGGQFSQALQLTETELQHAPADAKLWTMKGIALSKLGRDREALTAYKKALAISPDYLAALEGAAELEYNAGSSRAVGLLNRIVKLRPDNPTSHAMLGVIAFKQRDCVSAVKHFRASQQLIEAQPSALAQFGSCLMELQQAEDAIPVFQQIQRLRPDDSHARYNLAVAQLSAHRAQDSVSTLQHLVQTDPPDPDVLDLASSAYEETGDTPQAVALLRQAIMRDPKKS